MKNLMKMAGIIALTAVIGFSIVACSGGGGGISGTWLSTDGEEWIFNNGNLKQFDDGELFDELTYTVKGDKLNTVSKQFGDDEYTFTISGKEMRLFKDGNIKYIFNKK